MWGLWSLNVFLVCGLIEHYPHIATECEISALAPYVGVHFKHPVPTAYNLYSKGVSVCG